MIYCYPQPGKSKARKLCADFARGCGGVLVEDGRYRTDGLAMFYGIAPGMEGLWAEARRARSNGGGFYYCDNSFFDQTRQDYFRVAFNAVQAERVPVSDGKRFDQLRVEIKPWRAGGDHIVVCPQSDHFMYDVMQYNRRANWLTTTIAELRRHTSRPLRIREWNRDKTALAATLPQDLDGAHALVTFNSAAAVTALLEGVPVFVTGPSVCAPMASGLSGLVVSSCDLATIEHPERPDGRLQWAQGLADLQWTRAEMQSGLAWQMLRAQHDAMR